MNKFSRFLQVVIYFGIFLVPFIPLLITDFLYFPFITGKNFAFRIIVEIIGTAWLMLIIRDASYRLRFSLIHISVAIFLGIIVLSDIFGVNFHKSFWSNFGRMDGLLSLLHLVLYFFVISAMIKTEKKWSVFFHSSLASSLIVFIYGVFQLAGKIAITQGGVRLDATFGQATYLAVFALFNFFIAILISLKQQDKIDKIQKLFPTPFYIAIALLNVIIIFFTASRGVGLGIIVGVLLTAVLIATLEPEKKWLRYTAVCVFSIILIIMGMFMMVRKTDYVKNNKILSQFANIKLSEGTTRFIVWNIAYDGFKERPILGWGQGNFEVVFNKYYNPKLHDVEQWFDKAHNVFFDWLIEGGILGVFGYLFIFVSVFYVLWEKSNFTIAEKSVITGLLTAYFFQNLFAFDNITSYILFFSVIAFVYSHHTSSLIKNPLHKPTKHNDFLFKTTMPIAVTLFVLSIYHLNVKPILAGNALIKAVSFLEYDLSQNLIYYKKAIEYSVLAKAEAREQLLQDALRAKNVKFATEAVKKDFEEYAIEQMRLQIKESPDSARFKFFLGVFFRAIGRDKEALEALLSAREYSPNKQQIEFEIAAIYESMNESDKVLEIYQKAYENDPLFDTARKRYAILLIYDGQFEKASQILRERYKTDTPNDEDLLEAYLVAEKYEQAIAIQQEKIKNHPHNAQLLLSLAEMYYKIGDKTASVNAIEQVIVAKPTFLVQGKKMIAEIKLGRDPSNINR